MNERIKIPQENIQTPTDTTPKKEKYFWIELETTRSGHEKLSCKLNGKHFVGFLFEKERTNREGNVYGNYKLAKMKECEWENCSICFPIVII